MLVPDDSSARCWATCQSSWPSASTETARRDRTVRWVPQVELTRYAIDLRSLAWTHPSARGARYEPMPGIAAARR